MLSFFRNWGQSGSGAIRVVLLALLTFVFTTSFGIVARSVAQSTSSEPPSPTKPAAAAPLHGQKLAEAYCAGCHGVDGNSTDPQYPKIAGQKASYLRAQLQAFKSGVRKSDVMSGVAPAITNAQVAELARYYSGKRIKPDVVKDRRLADLGARVFRYPNRGAPPCAACHSAGGYGPQLGMGGRGGMMGGGMMSGGMGMMGNSANVPNLDGQHAAYIVKQLNDFASGARRGTVMGQIAAALPPQARRAVAEYLSGL